jgi:hypothetical protein
MDMKTKPQIQAIAAWEVPMHWNRIAKLLLPVLQRDEVDNTLEDVHQFLLAGTMQAWHIGWETVLVTMIQPFGAHPQAPTRKVCQIVYCAGRDMEEWLEPAFLHLDTWRRSLACDRLRISGRRGWVGALRRFGFEETYTTLEVK